MADETRAAAVTCPGCGEPLDGASPLDHEHPGGDVLLAVLDATELGGSVPERPVSKLCPSPYGIQVKYSSRTT